MAKNYFIFSFLYRVALGILIAYQNDNPAITVINTFLSVGFLMYQMVDLPYREGYQNYRAILCQLSVTTIMAIAMFYRSMKQNTPLDTKGYIVNPAYLQIGVIAFTILISTAVLCY